MTYRKPTRKQEMRRNIIFLSIIGLLILSIVGNLYSFYRISQIQNQYELIQETVNESNEANQEVLSMLKEIRAEQQEQKQIIQSEAYKNQITIKRLKANGFNEYNDLHSYSNITPEQMDKIINYYDSHIKGGTPFKNKGYVFVEASKQSGLNPLYLFAHAAVESGFGKSYFAKTKGNYYGINAVDNQPELAYSMGDTMEDGIISGAIWISNNFYKNGYTSLKSMKEGNYASDPEWEEKIINIMNHSIQQL